MTSDELTPEDRSELFGDFDPGRYAAEAEERWGGTDAWAESQRRVSSYTKADWERFKAESAEVTDRLVALMRAGTPADSAEAAAAAEEHRLLLSRWFYSCDVETHRGLGEMYVADPRFTSSIDRAAPGLAAYLRDAIAANAARAAS
ncbi:TipAS antibiotic-recognition domain-containing protein [Thermoactinospora rubra]|uniref:TipAS antibiotic-recognition domain-containing protein n=1 Tax=Thermoactinospora rubra TaxID=1088767 RepID=UPI000A104AC3|nr:TipAS antibiotic-recognition domain-containing protein [Thermoactinospora rubra]